MKSREVVATKAVCCLFCVLYTVTAQADPPACETYETIPVNFPYQVYVPVLARDLVESGHGIEWPECMDDLIRLARAGHPAGHDMLKELGDDAFGHALRFLIETPVVERNVMEALDLVRAADDPVLWDLLIWDLESGRIGGLCDPDLERLQTLMPDDAVLAIRYAAAMGSISGAPDYWARETSRILMENPEVVYDDELRGHGLRVAMEPMTDWLMEQSPEYLEALVEVLAVEHKLDLAHLMWASPGQLTVPTFARLLKHFYSESREPPAEWLGYFKVSFGDWVLAAFPAELRNAEQWDVAHRELLRRVDPVLHLLGEALAEMDPVMVAGYATALSNHESPVVRRAGHILRWELSPTYGNFKKAVSAGMTPALIASESREESAEALVLSSLKVEDATNLVLFIEHLDCYSILKMSGSERIAQAGDTPVADALRARVDECQE